MKYSLRSLLSVVTVAAVFIGLWGENWRTCRTREREHAQQADQLDEKIRAEVRLWIITRSGSSFLYHKLIQEHQRQAREHRSLAAEYRQAIWQPWKRWWIEELPPQDAKP
jgi:hypothetical protein